MEAAGQIIGGETATILIREKTGSRIEIGDLLVAEDDGRIILQVKELKYRSQIPMGMRELASGLELEGQGVRWSSLNLNSETTSSPRPAPYSM